MLGGFSYHWVVGAFAVTGIVLAALYILLMYQRTMTGPVRPGVELVTDLGRREVVAVAPLLLVMVLLGFYPQPLLDVINPAIETTMTTVGVQDEPPTVPADAVNAEEDHQ